MDEECIEPVWLDARVRAVSFECAVSRDRVFLELLILRKFLNNFGKHLFQVEVE